MSQNRRFVDPSLFTDAAGAEDLYANSIRSGLGYDAYGSNTEFDVIVLTTPLPLATSDAGMIIGQSFIKSKAEGGEGVIGSISFKGRIVGGNALSPHASLPDPCAPFSTPNVGTALKIINMHTTFISAGGYTGNIPSVGSTVRVKLDAGDYKFNLQYALFSEIMNPMGEAVSVAMGTDCTSLKSQFDNFDPDRDLSGVYLGASFVATQTPEEIQEQATNYDNADHEALPQKNHHAQHLAMAHPEFAPYIKAFIYKAWMELHATITINSVYRTPAHQARLLAEWQQDQSKPKPGRTSYHLYGMAFDFNPTLQNGTTLNSQMPAADWHASGIVAAGESVNLYWGGKFSTNYDPIHFDFRNVAGSTTAMASKVQAQNLSAAPNRVNIA